MYKRFFCGLAMIAFIANLSAQQPAKPKKWSIGVLTGPSPFELSETPEIINPVLIPDDVNDIFADVIAHPFVIKEKSKFYMFFTAKDKTTNIGGIGLAESADGTDWKYRKMTIQEPFVLSYPDVFKWKKDFYIVPETNTDSCIRLYKAVDFPEKWVCEAVLLKGDKYISPTVFHYKKTWWMFTSPMGNETLRLFYADDLRGPWIEHPQSPVIYKDMDKARPAGRPLIFEGKLYRLGMDCLPSYGNKVHAYEITVLSKTSYSEVMIETPLIKASGKGWNSEAMHHLDAFKISKKKWIGIVDAAGD